MRRSVFLALALLLPAAVPADAATVAVGPAKPCYRSGENPTIAGAGFTPNGAVNVTSDGRSIGQAQVNAVGFFAGKLTVGLASGERLKTYSATDTANPALSASIRLRLSAVAVSVSPPSGKPGRRLRIKARGFTTGKHLYAHVRHARTVRRNVRVGKLKRACHKLKRKRRISPRGAPGGRYLVQFDTRRRYSKHTPVRVRFKVTVFPVLGASTALAWTRAL